MLFAKKVWHLLVSIKDGLVLAFMLLFFGVLYSVLSTRPNPGQVRDGALLIRLSGVVVEEPAEQGGLEALVSGPSPVKEYRARDVTRAITLAAGDDRIKAVVLDLSAFMGGGLVTMQEIGAAIDKVRAAKKPILTYAVAYTDDSLLLAAHASESWVHPMGGAAIAGPGGNRSYYAGLIERFKINVHVFKVGTFKDFVEPYQLSGASTPSREARTALLGSLWQTWLADVSKARPKAQWAMVAKDPVAWATGAKGDLAQASVKAGMIDRIGDDVAFGERVRTVTGDDSAQERPGGFAATRMSALLAAHKPKQEGKAVAVVTVAGEIIDGKAGPGTAGGERIARLIDDANQDEAAALVLRVDSPGGSVLASEQIRGALERFKAKGRPIVVSMANVAASGGYWVSTPAKRIFAEPGTVTGSIGIFAILPTFEKALAEYGVTSDGVKTTPLSGQPDLFGGLSPETVSVMQASVESGYERFVALVGKSRGKNRDQVDAIAQGRAWDGGTAHQIGLIDQFGGLDDALGYAASQARLESWHAKFYAGGGSTFGGLLGLFEDEDEEAAQGRDLFAQMAIRQQVSLGAALDGLARLGRAQGAQALCLECTANLPARPLAPTTGWLGAWARLISIH